MLWDKVRKYKTSKFGSKYGSVSNMSHAQPTDSENAIIFDTGKVNKLESYG